MQEKILRQANSRLKFKHAEGKKEVSLIILKHKVLYLHMTVKGTAIVKKGILGGELVRSKLIVNHLENDRL